MNIERVISKLFEEYLEEFLNNIDMRAIADNLIISDVHQKVLQMIASKDELSPEDETYIAYAMGPDKDGRSLFDADREDWSDDMVAGYAQNLRNYLYTYKESARQADPTIDPNEKHVGPMAQDIEKVAPDCVKESPEGIKMVDGNRLALVNAGVIGDLSRKILELEARLNGR